MYNYIFLPLLSFLLTFFFIRYFISQNSFIKILDNPNNRSMHEKPVPRTGGIAIFSGVFFSIFFSHINYASESQVLLPFIGFLIIAIVSLVDDIRSLKPLIRLIAHFLGAALLLSEYFSFSSIPAVIMFVAIIFFIVWFINLYNFMDGLDGLCGSMSFSGFLVFGVIFFQYKFFDLSIFCFIFTGAIIAFLIFNFPPAKIFMGDAGSIGTGYLFTALSIYSVYKGIFSPIIPLIIFLPFIYDASYTLLRRILKGERPWQAHRKHFYQRLAISDIGKLNTLYIEIVLILSSIISAFFLIKKNMIIQFFSLFFFIIVLIIIEKFFFIMLKKK